MGVLDEPKLISGTSGDTRQALLKAMPHINLSDRPSRDVNNPGLQSQDTTVYDDFDVQLVRVIRNNKIDALGFEVLIRNKTGHIIYFDPESFAVRVGENVFSQVTADISPSLPPNAQMRAWFCDHYFPNGCPNYLSADNDFTVLLTEVNAAGQKQQCQPSRPVFSATNRRAKTSFTNLGFFTNLWLYYLHGLSLRRSSSKILRPSRSDSGLPSLEPTSIPDLSFSPRKRPNARRP